MQEDIGIVEDEKFKNLKECNDLKEKNNADKLKLLTSSYLSTGE
jgi:hypothetical protein